MTKNKNTSLSWDDFQSLGNPNSPDLSSEKDKAIQPDNFNHLMDVRIWLDKKKRKGKKATLIKGINLDEDALKLLCKDIKSKCGVGGSAKGGEIIIQGDQRNKVLEILIDRGFSKSKLAGG
ncbi:MAG: translation initiation factor [Saprospiraceae bacterium]